MKKFGLFVTILVLLFAGCSGAAQETEQSDKKIKIEIAHYWGDTDTDVSAQYLKKIVEEDFPEAFPNVELVQNVYDNETYKRRIKVMMASDDLPDIMFGYGGGFSEAFVESGKVLKLDDYLDESYKEKMGMDMQENFIYDGSQYGICFAYWVGVLYCNKSLFAQAGVEIPQTYEELLTSCQTLRENDIQPIACGMLDKWPGQQWINNFTIQLGGAELYKQMASGQESLDNEMLAQSADLVQKLIRADAFCDDMYNLTSQQAEDMFLKGNAAMIYIGNWYTGNAEESLGDDLAVVKMPTIPGAQYPNDYHGGGINGWLVSADTESPELATEIAEWLSYRLSCYQPQTSTFKIAERDQMAAVGDTEQQILDIYKDKENGGCAWDTLMKPKRADIWLDLCGKLFDLKFNGKGFVKLLRSQADWGMDS